MCQEKLPASWKELQLRATAFQDACDMGEVRNLKESKLIFLFDVPILIFFFLSHLMFLNLIPVLHIQSIKQRKARECYGLFNKQNLQSESGPKSYPFRFEFLTVKNDQENQIICLYCLNN